MKPDPLIRKFYDAPQSLTREEVEELKNILQNPENTKQLKTQWFMDELLSRKLRSDRRFFSNGVFQRIRDAEEGNSRKITYQHITGGLSFRDKATHFIWKNRGAAAAAVLALAAGIILIIHTSMPSSEGTARITSHTPGKVKIYRSGKQMPYTSGGIILPNDRIMTEAGGTAELEYIAADRYVRVS